MLAKWWKKIGLLILIVACIFNIMIKFINKMSLNDELEASATYVNIIYGKNYYYKKEVNLQMKEGMHPTYNQTTITCACGNVLEVGSTKTDLKVDVCSKCHPYWTGNLRLDTKGGRADRFKKKYGLA